MSTPHTSAHATTHSLYDVFLRVASDGSFTAAAQALGYTQSAVSRQVQALEDELGSVLFDRLARGCGSPRPGGCWCARRGRTGPARRRPRRALRAAHARRRTAARRGVLDRRRRAAPRALAAFRRRHPGVTLARTEGPSVKHLGLLAAEELDIAVVSATAGRALDGCALRHLLDEPMFVAMPQDHPLAGRKRLRLAELADEEWVAGSTRPEDTLMRPVLEAGFRPRTTLVVRDWIAKQGFVAPGSA
ncbi:LysR family transcriptional regulator [Streptomyces sp. BPTC-684]|uniref:LysR family transcriptional regulator n=1 Tax=Streptomyces sp. BPTC-684 TaxID=3043734 RepID=UPI0024B1E3E2|nr:LysR family transcriptional regulator [Streptomyces sp. BPTC-684]WHM38874.1 LysR family transcriptional regulator [Streptomyces sp. BPTC-684]